MEDCIFCKIIEGEIPCFKVYEDNDCLAFADINPIAEGHILIIPKTHADNLWEITGESLATVHMASKKIIQGIKDALNPIGVAALQLNGKGVNQTVMHYHLHLIPRLEGNPALPMHWELKQGDMDAIGKTAGKIAASIK